MNRRSSHRHRVIAGSFLLRSAAAGCADRRAAIPCASRGRVAWFARARASLRATIERHRTRPRLAVLDERMLHDIGLTPDLAGEESRKSFWRL
jgi:uncharacterized protein YjiS (DUF1127 family)